ncbi:MAG: hypothetical protein C3F11_17315 [Methylocystaceae bacterium]|nr:MAG: hypothetical protein C3F11_17315 [Methylocystaceae bacterium]
MKSARAIASANLPTFRHEAERSIAEKSPARFAFVVSNAIERAFAAPAGKLHKSVVGFEGRLTQKAAARVMAANVISEAAKALSAVAPRGVDLKPYLKALDDVQARYRK